MEILLSILGSLASIGGTIWAYVQARRSKTFAEQAKPVRDVLVERRKTIEVSKVNSETARIFRLVSKVGPTCTSTSVKAKAGTDIFSRPGCIRSICNAIIIRSF